MTLHAHMERFNATQNQKTVLRPADCSAGVLDKVKAFGQFRVSDHKSAHDHIAVSPQVFRGAVHDQISPQVQGLL